MLLSKINSSKKQNGFTFIELAIVLVIVGFLLASFSAALKNYLEKSKQDKNSIKIETIELALDTYFNAYGKLPCPASPTALPDTAAFGRQVALNCTSAPQTTQVVRVNNLSKNIRIGAVPVRDLNIPDEYIMDANNNKFIYAVTETSATPGEFDINGGGISIVDSNDNSVITPPNSAHYAVLSTGQDGVGSYNLVGTVNEPCVAGSQQSENCDNDGVFRSTLLVSTAGTTDQNDDTLLFKLYTKDNLPLIPERAVMAFNSANCPIGWVPLADSAGRVIVGSGAYNEDYDQAGYPSWQFSHDYALNEKGGYATWRARDSELVQHKHPLSSATLNLTIGTDEVNVIVPPSETGENDGVSAGVSGSPEENRSPYLVLTYCEYGG